MGRAMKALAAFALLAGRDLTIDDLREIYPAGECPREAI